MTRDPALARRLRMQAAACVLLVAGMTGLAYAAVPLYDLFCKVTGFGGTTRVASAAPSSVSQRSIEIRFDANRAPGVPIAFAPSQRRQTIRLGETGLAFFTVENRSDRPVTAVATYNVTPHKTGPYFQKLECFCFQDRVFQPGEKIELPVVYYVAPELAEDPEAEEVQTITLSYTFFEAAGARAEQAAKLGDRANAS